MGFRLGALPVFGLIVALLTLEDEPVVVFVLPLLVLGASESSLLLSRFIFFLITLGFSVSLVLLLVVVVVVVESLVVVDTVILASLLLLLFSSLLLLLLLLLVVVLVVGVEEGFGLDPFLSFLLSL